MVKAPKTLSVTFNRNNEEIETFADIKVSESKKNDTEPRKWSTSSEDILASVVKLEKNIVYLSDSNGKEIKATPSSFNQNDLAFINNALPKHWSKSDHSLLKAILISQNATSATFLNSKKEKIEIPLSELSESDKMILNFKQFRTWKDRSNNTLEASLIKIQNDTCYLKTNDLQVFAIKRYSLSLDHEELLDELSEQTEYTSTLQAGREALASGQYSVARDYYHKAMRFSDNEELTGMIKKIKFTEENEGYNY